MDNLSCKVYVENEKYGLDRDEMHNKLSQYFQVSKVDEMWYIEESRTVWIAYKEEN